MEKGLGHPWDKLGFSEMMLFELGLEECTHVHLHIQEVKARICEKKKSDMKNVWQGSPCSIEWRFAKGI